METGSGNRSPRLGVIGLGNVGRALYHTLSFYHDTVGYDLKRGEPWGPILATEALFVCVQTPVGRDGRLDPTRVRDVLARLERDGYRGLVAVRSTVGIGFMDDAAEEFPGLRLVYFPEFLRERSRLQWSICPDRLVVGGAPALTAELLTYFEWAEEARRIRMSFREAEIGKLAHNAFIATKVSFTNEIERICEEQGASADAVMRVVTADRRVASEEHLRPGLGPYGGSCVPKDTSELRVAGRSSFLEAVEAANARASERQGRMNGRLATPSDPATTGQALGA